MKNIFKDLLIKRFAVLLIAAAMLITSMPTAFLSYANEPEEPAAATEIAEEPAAEAEISEEPKEETEKTASPALNLSKKADGVTVSLKADAGVFPEGATLSVSTISKSEQKKVDAAIDEEKKDEKRVASSYTFDIKVLDKDGKELQPADGKSVNLSFTTDEVAEDILSTRVFHIDEEKNELNATELSVSTDGDTATVETDGFSYYTVEFTYGDLQYVLEGDGTVKLSDILKSIGIEGEVKDTKVSNSKLFDVITKDGELYVASHKAFTSEEWLDVTMTDGTTYHIIVTDAIIDSGKIIENIPGVAQGVYPNHTQNIPLGDIWIDDSVLNASIACRNNATFIPGELMDQPGFIVYDTSQSSTGKGHGGYTANYCIEYDTHQQPLTGQVETKLIATGQTVYQSYNSFKGVIGTFMWKDAAVRLGADGKEEKLDVYIEYSNPIITISNEEQFSAVPEIKDRYIGLFSGNMVTVGQTLDETGALRAPCGVEMTIRPYIKDKNKNIVAGNFYYPMTDIDVVHRGNRFTYLYQAREGCENYVATTDGYSEAVHLDQSGMYTNSRKESLFIPGAEGDDKYKSIITYTNGEYIVSPGYESPSDTNTQYSGFTLLAINDKFSLKYMGSTQTGTGAGMENYVLSGQNYNFKIRHSTSPTQGGHIQTTREGNHSGELDDESGVIEPNILASSSGQTIVYTFYPEQGYTLSGVYVNSGKDCTDWPETGGDWDEIDNKYSDKKIKEGDGTGNTYQAHDDNGDGVVDRYTYTFSGINSDNAIHVTWQKTVLTITKRVTGNDIVDDTFTFRIRAQSTEDPTQFVDFKTAAGGKFTPADENWYTFTLGNFETLTLDQSIIPVDYKWEVEEIGLGTKDRWTCVEPKGGKVSGTITQDDQVHQANFLNKRNKNIDPDKSIKVQKIWEGDNEDLRPKRLVMHAYSGMSFLKTGPDLMAAMQGLADGKDNIYAFKKGTEAQYKKASNPVKVSVEGPPTYFWYENNTIYFYSEADVYLNEDSSKMFDTFTKLKDISGLANVHVDYTEDFSRMFANCYAMNNLKPLTNWNTANAKTMETMLGSMNVQAGGGNPMTYTSLEPLQNWNVKGVKDMSKMFRGAQITSVEKISGWETYNLKTMNNMFFRSLVTDGDELSGWDVSHVDNTNTKDGGFYQVFRDFETGYYSGQVPNWTSRTGSWGKNTQGNYTGTYSTNVGTETDPGPTDWKQKPTVDPEGKTLDEVYHDVQSDGSWLYEFEVPEGTEDLKWRIYEDLPAGYKVYYKDSKDIEHEGIGDKDDPVTGVTTGKAPIVLINKRINRELTIGKALTEKLAAAESFEFIVKFWTGASKYKNMYDIDPVPVDVKKVADGTYKFTLKTDGSSVVEQEFTDLPYGLKYEVTEELPTGWRLIESYHDSGVMDESKTASFLNGRNQNGIVLKLWDDHEDRFDTRPVGKPDSIQLKVTIKNYKWEQIEGSVIDAYEETAPTEFAALKAAYEADDAKDLDKLQKNIVDAADKRLLLTAPKYIKYNNEPYVCDKKAETRYVAFKVTDISTTRDAYSTDDDLIFEEDDDLDGWYYEFPMADSERIEEVVEEEIDIPYYTVSEPKETSKGLVFEVTNKLKEHKLDVKKEVTDPADDTTTEFNFAIKFWSEVDQYTHHPVKFMHSHFVTTKDAQGEDVQEFEYVFEKGVMLGDKNVEGIHEKIGDQVISRPNSGKDSDKVTMKEGDRITEALRNFTISNADKIPASDDKPWAAYITMYDTGLTLADLGLTYGGLDSFEIYVEQSPDAVNGKFENGRRIDYFLVPTGAPPFSVRTPYTGLDEAYKDYGTNGTYHFKLKNGDKFDFKPLPVGVFYEIVEYKDSKWNLVKSTNAKGTLPDNDVTATFTNEKKKGTVKIAKKTMYNTPGTFKFRAKILKENGEYMDLSKQGATLVSGEEGVYEFTLANGKEKLIENIPINSEYEVWELLEGDVWELVSINDDESAEKAEGTIYGDHVYSYTFKNKGPIIYPSEEQEISRTIHFTYEKKNGKQVTGKIVQKVTITRVALELDPETGKVLKWGPWSSATFPAVKNPDKEAGPGWATKDVAPALTVNGPIEVKDVFVVYHKTSDCTDCDNDSKGAETGDETNMALWIGLLAAAVIAVVAVIIRRRRRDG